MQRKKPQGDWTRRQIENEIDRLLAMAPLLPFCMVGVAWLRKKLARL